MSVQVYSVLGQTEGRNKTFLERKSIDLHGISQCLLSTCGGNVNYYKSVHQPIPTRENREHPGNLQSESVSSDFNEKPCPCGFKTGMTNWVNFHY